MCVCVCVCVRSSVGERWCESQQRFDQVQLLSVLAGEDRGLLVVLHQFIDGVELALADTVHSLRLLHFKVLILSGRLQRHGEIVGLKKQRGRQVDVWLETRRSDGRDEAALLQQGAACSHR